MGAIGGGRPAVVGGEPLGGRPGYWRVLAGSLGSQIVGGLALWALRVVCSLLSAVGVAGRGASIYLPW